MNTTNTAPAFNLPALAAAICAALPGEWAAKPAFKESPEGNQHLTREKDGLTLWLSGPNYSHKDKHSISLSRPRDAKGRQVTLYPTAGTGTISDPSIGVSIAKDGAQIAADVARRLLPDAETVYAAALAKIAQENARESAHEETTKALYNAIGKPLEKGHDGETRKSLYVPNPTGSPYSSLASVEIRGPESVRIEIDANRTQALALIAFLRSPAYLFTVTPEVS